MNIYFDMDGVLAKYDRNAYIDKDAPFYQKGVHYFRYLEADTKMVDLYHTLEKYYNTFIISSVITDPPELCIEHIRDKIYWLVTYDIYHDNNALFSITNKPTCAVYHHQKLLTESDILIDDFNQNLWLWEKNGGTGIKYLNGINDEKSYSGLKISESMPNEKIYNLIKKLEKR